MQQAFDFLTVAEGNSNTKQIKSKRRGAFTDNMSLPVHRWYRYSAGFSAEWARSVIGDCPQGTNILDPFAGSGTALLAADAAGFASLGFEAHPFVTRIAGAKLLWHADAQTFLHSACNLVSIARKD